MSAFRLPRIESYLSRCASVAASVRSLTATMSMSSCAIAARMMLRPIRPNPLIPTLMVMNDCLPVQNKSSNLESYQDEPAGLSCRRPCTCSTRSSCSSWRSSLSPWFLYQAIRVPEVHRQPGPADGLPARQLQPGRRRVDLDSRRLGRRGPDGARAHRRPARALSRSCASSSRRRR